MYLTSRFIVLPRGWCEEEARLEDMDDTDRRIMLLICGDPRISVREIAKRVGLSRQAASHRINIFTKMGVFKSMRAALSMFYVDAIVVLIWGRSKARSAEKIMDKLGESDFTHRVTISGGNEVHILAALSDESELDGYVDFVKRAAEVPEPTVGMLSYGDGINPEVYDGGKRKTSYKELSALDLKIIAALQDDARKPTAEIARIAGVSAKTVKRHLDAMRSDGSLDFDQPWDLSLGEDMFTFVHVDLRSGADRVKVARRLLSKDSLHIQLMRQFTNLPNCLFGLICSDKMSEIRRMLRDIGEDDDVLSVTPNLIYLERMYWTWDERLPTAVVRSYCQTGHHRERRGHRNREFQ